MTDRFALKLELCTNEIKFLSGNDYVALSDIPNAWLHPDLVMPSIVDPALVRNAIIAPVTRVNWARSFARLGLDSSKYRLRALDEDLDCSDPRTTYVFEADAANRASIRSLTWRHSVPGIVQGEVIVSARLEMQIPCNSICSVVLALSDPVCLEYAIAKYTVSSALLVQIARAAGCLAEVEPLLEAQRSLDSGTYFRLRRVLQPAT